jgi:hypothetical protein
MHTRAKRIVFILASVFPPSFKSSGIRRFLIPLHFLALTPLAIVIWRVEPSFADRVHQTIAAALGGRITRL